MSRTQAAPNLARVNDLLAYDPLTGIFTWKVTRGSRAQAGARAGTPSNDYRQIRIDGVIYKEHHLAWYMTYGEWPTLDIDHEDTVKSHNWIENLREATKSQNQYNRKLGQNKSGFKGVTRGRHGWVAKIRIDKKSTYLGSFRTPQEASACYQEAAVKHAGKFARF
ncbi:MULTISPECIES: HNH endonuclease [unclassified Methylobacterium]|uniref:HNH endonuclease n=1 Tax=unclassified Methylobacterium TaxID=2615210 RepID=UPI0011C1FFF1|nr:MULTISPECIES: HNH endonuclease [unclassified Methylobacterium]QEE37964.1 hypothetical protein FVA80_02265 [Methylobacterium sp. WL1]TXN59804.1 hypothetical protein FV241_00095 [Methylobacterium sp. WL2]